MGRRVRTGAGRICARRIRTDGETVTAGGWKGFALGEDGFLTVAAELKKQHHSERSAYDTRQFYPLVNGAYDPRELTANRYDTWSGDPELKQATVFANAGRTFADGQKIYGWASYQRRETESAGFFRRPLQEVHSAGVFIWAAARQASASARRSGGATLSGNTTSACDRPSSPPKRNTSKPGHKVVPSSKRNTAPACWYTVSRT